MQKQLSKTYRARWAVIRRSVKLPSASSPTDCALHEPGTLVEAAAAYRKSLEINPGQLEALANLGDAYLQMGQIEKAKSTLADAAKVNSNDSKLHRSFGELYLKLGMRDDAQREHEVLKQLDPSLANDLAKLLDTSAHS